MACNDKDRQVDEPRGTTNELADIGDKSLATYYKDRSIKLRRRLNPDYKLHFTKKYLYDF